MNEERMITLPVDKVRHAVDMIVASMDFGSGFFDQEDVDFLRDMATQLGDVCLQAVTPADMRPKYPTCVGIETWVVKTVEEQRVFYAERGLPRTDEEIERHLRSHPGHEDHPM